MATFNFTSFGAENLFLGGNDDARVNNVSTFNTSDSISGAAGDDNVLFINCPTPLTMITSPTAYAGIQGIERISIFSDERHVVVRADAVAIADGGEGLLAEVGEGRDLEEIGALRERRQMHHLRDAATTNDTNSQWRHRYQAGGCCVAPP